MRKLFAAFFLVFLVSGAAATTINAESLVLDLEKSEASATVEVKDLTSSKFTYITSAEVTSVEAQTNGEKMPCNVETLAVGSEIRCDTDRKENFTVDIKYSFSGLVYQRGNTRTFRYSHPIYRPTENFYLRVDLPAGAGLTDSNSSDPAISPQDGETGSDGRRIFVAWEKEPQIGDTLSFSVDYQGLTDEGTDYLRIFGMVFVILLFAGAVYLYWRRMNRESIESVYGDLSDDELDVVELLKENDGEMLQKDVVDSSDYSKAKISGVVSDLVEKDIVEKEKEGRSNKLKISGKYRY